MDRRRLVTTAAGMALAAAILAGPALAADRVVTISGFAFAPATVTVRVGEGVTWRNQDGTAHTATSGFAWTTGDIAPGDSATITFRKAGMFDYICAIHPTMTGRVVVRAAGGGTPPPTETEPATATGDDGGRLGATLAFLGVVLVVGTLVADRRLRQHRPDG
jgi:plastocyanin